MPSALKHPGMSPYVAGAAGNILGSARCNRAAVICLLRGETHGTDGRIQIVQAAVGGQLTHLSVA